MQPTPLASRSTLTSISKSGEGKTELKQNVDDVWPNHWLLRAGSTSDQGMVDADKWDARYIGAFAEFQQMQGKMLEMVKSSAGDDADERGVGFVHTRNVDDGDGGRTDEDIEKQAMPTVFLFADENNAEIPKELDTRQMTLRVESDEDINRAVAKVMFDHNEVSVADREYDYNFNFEDGKNAVRNHLANIPRNVDANWGEDPKDYAYPVVIPHDEDVEWPIHSYPDADTYGWDIFNVVEPILSYKKTQSKRGARAIANHIRSWARMNYHTRSTMDINGETYYVADPQDVANVLSYRDLLLAVTHDMDEQKLAVIEALTDEQKGVGGPGPNGGLQATEKDIAKYIDKHADITALSSHQLHNGNSTGVLDEMEDDYLIEVHEGEGANGAHLYEFLGGSTFGHPNIDAYPNLFEHTTDPIRDQPIAETVREFEQSISVQTSEDLLSGDPMNPTNDSADDDSGSLSDFGGGEDPSPSDYDETDEAVHERLQDTLNGQRIAPEDVEGMGTAHMLGIAPTETYSDTNGPHIRADGPVTGEHTRGSILDSSHALWGDKSDGQVEDIVNNSIAKLRADEVFEIHEDDDADNDHKLFTVQDI